MHLIETKKWIINTRATNHATSDRKMFDELSDYVRNLYITSGNWAQFPVKVEGTISYSKFIIALLIPNIKCNLLLVGKLLDTLLCSAHFYPHILLFSRH